MAVKKVAKSKKSSPTRAAARTTSTTKGAATKSKKVEKKEVKKTTSKKSSPKNSTPKKTTKVNKPASKRGGANREMDETTGFAVGTDSHFIAETLLEGGESRQDIIDGLRDSLESETRNGTEKPVANLVSGVVNKMLERGFTIESSFRLVPPTPASKRAATRAASKKTAAPVKSKGKTAAKGKGKRK